MPRTSFAGFPPQIWLLFVLVQCMNGAFWWFRGVAQHPERRSGYVKLVAAWVLLGNIPWAILSVGALSGRITSVDEVFKPSHGNPFVLAFFISVFVLLLLADFWVFIGNGAQMLIDHPGLSNRPLTSSTSIKLYFLLSTIMSACVATAMWFVK